MIPSGFLWNFFQLFKTVPTLFALERIGKSRTSGKSFVISGRLSGSPAQVTMPLIFSSQAVRTWSSYPFTARMILMKSGLLPQISRAFRISSRIQRRLISWNTFSSSQVSKWFLPAFLSLTASRNSGRYSGVPASQTEESVPIPHSLLTVPASRQFDIQTPIHHWMIQVSEVRFQIVSEGRGFHASPSSILCGAFIFWE